MMQDSRTTRDAVDSGKVSDPPSDGDKSPKMVSVDGIRTPISHKLLMGLRSKSADGTYNNKVGGVL